MYCLVNNEDFIKVLSLDITILVQYAPYMETRPGVMVTDKGKK